jgi:hypothetical protein
LFYPPSTVICGCISGCTDYKSIASALAQRRYSGALCGEKYCQHVLFSRKFRRKFQENAKKDLLRGVVSAKTPSIGAMTLESKELRHGLQGKWLLTQPTDGALFLERHRQFLEEGLISNNRTRHWTSTFVQEDRYTSDMKNALLLVALAGILPLQPACEPLPMRITDNADRHNWAEP